MEYLVDQIPIPMSKETKKYLADRAFGVIVWADWFCGAKDIREIFESQPSLLACALLYIVCSIFTLIHAFRNGGRYVYLWCGAFTFGLTCEFFAKFLTSGPIFWHTQSLLTLFGRRTPAYIVFGFYPTVFYTSVVSASKLHLPWLSRSCASGLLSLLLGVPYFLLGAKHLWFTFHDTDPNVKDRFYDVPYTVLQFLLSAGCSLDFMLTILRSLILPLEYNWKLFFREFSCAVTAGFVAFWLMPFFFIPFYNAFHDQFGVSSSLCVLAPILIFAFVVWISDRNPHKLSRPNSQNGYNQYWFDELCVLITIYFLFFMTLVLILDPATVSSSGLHEPIGLCDSYEKIGSILGDLIMKRRRYLCPTRFNKANFDFSCLPPSATPKMRDGVPLEWYTICGTKVDNLIEYCFATWLFCTMGLAAFFVAFAASGELPKIAYKSLKKRKHE